MLCSCFHARASEVSWQVLFLPFLILGTYYWAVHLFGEPRTWPTVPSSIFAWSRNIHRQALVGGFCTCCFVKGWVVLELSPEESSSTCENAEVWGLTVDTVEAVPPGLFLNGFVSWLAICPPVGEAAGAVALSICRSAEHNTAMGDFELCGLLPPRVSPTTLASTPREILKPSGNVPLPCSVQVGKPKYAATFGGQERLESVLV